MFKNMVNFSLSFVKLVFHELARADFQAVPATLTILLARVFSGFGQTKIVEDAFQRMRNAEANRAGKILTNSCVWQQLVAKQLLSQLNSYREVDVANVADETAKTNKDALPEGVFTPAYNEASMREDFKKLPGWRLCVRVCCSVDIVAISTPTPSYTSSFG